MEHITLTKNQIIEVLIRSPHGKLEEYIPVGRAAAAAEPEFLAHLIAWNHTHGSIRDSKVALPILSLSQKAFAPDLAANSLAHLALLDPRNFVRALEFSREVGVVGRGRVLRGLVRNYLSLREESWGLWERAVIQHRKSMKRLYALYHVKPGSEAYNKALFKGEPPIGSTLWVISQLARMEPKEALGQVLTRKIPFLVAVGALGPKLQDPDAVLALINAMSDSELTNNAAMLDRLGVKTNPALRSAFKARLDALGREQEVKTHRGVSLKAGVAAAAIGDGDTAAALQRAQERQIKATGGVKGRWLICGDKSGSMEQTIEVSRFVAGTLARFAEESHLVFYDTSPYYKNCTGLTLEQVQEITQHVRGAGGTHAGVCIAYMLQRNIQVDGIVVVTDCEDGQPLAFEQIYTRYCQHFGNDPTLYCFKVRGGAQDTLSRSIERLQGEIFDLRAGVDYYSVENLIKTMNTRRWSLLDQIMETPLLKLTDVFTKETRNAATATA